MIAYLKIVRPINLLLIILTMGLIKFRLFGAFEIPLALNTTGFILLVLATVLIAAGGNVINDLYDVEIDTVNKPQKMLIGKSISEKNGFRFYMVLTILGVGLGFWVANIIGKPGLAVLFIFTTALLYWYATHLKSIVLIGNSIVSFLVGLSLLMLVLFDIFPSIELEAHPLHFTLSKVVLYYALAAFWLNLIREIVKDLEDINGDKNGGRMTLPIVLGCSRTTVIVFAMGLLFLFLLILLSYYQLYAYPPLLFYFIFFIIGPLGLFCIKSWQAEKMKDYAQLSLLLKITMFTGAGSLAIIEISIP